MIFEAIARHARSTPDRTALVFGAERLSYRDLCARATAGARRLASLGVERGDAVFLVLENGIEFVVAFFAAARMGAIVVTIDPAHTIPEIAHMAQECRPRVAVARTAHLETLQAALGPETALVADGTVPLSLADLTATVADNGLARRQQESGDFLLQYTSGSTGRPKGVLQTQRGLLARVTSWNETAGLRADDVHLCILTLNHGYGLYCVAVPALVSGGTLHLHQAARPGLPPMPEAVLRYLIEVGVTCFYALPIFYQLLARVQRRAVEDEDLSRIRLAMVGSAPVVATTVLAFHERFGITLNNTYGLSESGILTSDLEPTLPDREVSIGRPLRGVEIRLENGPDAGGSTGELVIRYAGMADRYFGTGYGLITPEGWFHTGDLVRVASDGKLYLAGRLSQFINVAGNKVGQREVEDAIEMLAGVREVAVVGLPDERTHQRVVAFVVGEGVTEADVRRACREQLAPYKHPREIHFCSALPKGPNGKVRKQALIENVRQE